MHSLYTVWSHVQGHGVIIFIDVFNILSELKWVEYVASVSHITGGLGNIC